jgi:hypothetical protein
MKKNKCSEMILNQFVPGAIIKRKYDYPISINFHWMLHQYPPNNNKIHIVYEPITFTIIARQNLQPFSDTKFILMANSTGQLVYTCLHSIHTQFEICLPAK